MIHILAFFTLLAAVALGQECSPITSTVIVQGTAASPTISAGTVATVGPSARVLLLGARTTYVTGASSSIRTNLATATVSNTGSIPRASYASVSVDYLATAAIGPDARAITVDVDINGKAVLEAGATSALLIARAPGARITARGVSFGDVQAKVDTYVEATFVEGPNTVMADDNARVSAVGPSVTAFVAQTAWYGQVTITGADASCTVGREGQCTINGDRAQATASGFRASVEVQGGTGGTAFVTEGGTASVAGSNTALVSSGGVASIGPGAAATIGARGLGIISAGNGDVYVQPTGYASLEGGATVFLGPQATASASPGVSLTSIGMRDDYVILSAMAGPSGLRRRAALPQPTCAMGTISCPNVNGGTDCVNVDNDIANCGGCAFDGLGIDCTTVEGIENVICRAGQCIET